MKQLLTKKTIAVAFATSIILAVLVFLVTIPGKKTNNPAIPTTPTPVRQSPNNIPSGGIAALPDKTTTLSIGTKQQFTIVFPAVIREEDIHVSLTKTDITKDTPAENVPVEQVLEPDRRTVTITMQEPVEAYNQYTLSLLDKNGQTIQQENYLSETSQITPAPTNNPALAQFLPYETLSYRLSYNPATNTYIFNFKYNPGLLDDLDTQYANAKDAATKFIQDKGININTIVIEWRYS